jgi:hypothetical protein
MTGTLAALAADPKLSHAEVLQKSVLAMIDNAQPPDWGIPNIGRCSSSASRPNL